MTFEINKLTISIIGLGYVGLPIAVAFSKKVPVIGFDINPEKIESYKNNIDPTGEIGNKALQECNVKFTSDPVDIRKANFHIVAVPTPIRDDKTPDLRPIESASKLLGQNLQSGSTVVFESTVFPGVTEDICVPILEKESGLKCCSDFKLGYSPERINPGDEVHRLETITKIVSGIDEESLNLIARVYELVVEAGVYRAPSIKVAEAAKVIENSQRDINIAFMNELSIIFNKMGIDTQAVLRAAGTKWNFLNFQPGLVGGHCIGVDPYYLTYKAEKLGYHSQIILAGRRINDGMGKYVAENTVKLLISTDRPVKHAKVAILGLTFKENCPDTRNTRVVDIIDELNEYGIEPLVCDPVADPDETRKEYGIDLVPFQDIHGVDAIIVAVSHHEFKALSIEQFEQLFQHGKKGVFIDVKGIFDRNLFENEKFEYWRL